jgi:hypothetical protein
MLASIVELKNTTVDFFSGCILGWGVALTLSCNKDFANNVQVPKEVETSLKMKGAPLLRFPPRIAPVRVAEVQNYLAEFALMPK